MKVLFNRLRDDQILVRIHHAKLDITPESIQNEPLILEELHTDQAEPVAQSLVQVPLDTFDILMEATNQVDSSIVSELVVLQERIKLLKNQNSSLA